MARKKDTDIIPDDEAIAEAGNIEPDEGNLDAEVDAVDGTGDEANGPHGFEEETTTPTMNPFSGSQGYVDDDELPDGGIGDDDEEDFEEDFTDVDESGPRQLPIGYHRARCVDFEKTESKNGNPQYEWSFIVIGGTADGQKGKAWTSLVPAARWKVVQFLIAFGIKAAGSIAKFKKSQIVGKSVVIEVTESTYNGKKSNKIDNLWPDDGTYVDLPVDPSDPTTAFNGE